MTRRNSEPERQLGVSITATPALLQGIALMPPGTESSALPRGLPISLDPEVKYLIERAQVGSQLLVSVDRDEAIQSIQGEHVPSEVVVESVKVSVSRNPSLRISSLLKLRASAITPRSQDIALSTRSGEPKTASATSARGCSRP